MQIAIISDIHDHISTLQSALKKAAGAEVLICCGDLCSPFIVDELGTGFTHGDIHVVFGNNDADLFRITSKSLAYDHLHLHGEFVELELGGKKFAVNHFDNIGRALASTDRYDVVCFGHNHQFELSTVGNTQIINPGEIMGELTGAATFVIYNSEKNQVSRIEI